jgi:hypothetical protein
MVMYCSTCGSRDATIFPTIGQPECPKCHGTQWQSWPPFAGHNAVWTKTSGGSVIGSVNWSHMKGL